MAYTANEIADLAKSIVSMLRGKSLRECFSQHKEELILGFADEKEECWMICHLDPEVSLLGFPLQYHRARHNSVDLFRPVVDMQVKSGCIHALERSFHLEFSTGWCLIFKLHGRNSNVLLANADREVVEIFRNNLKKDLSYKLSDMVLQSVEDGRADTQLLKSATDKLYLTLQQRQYTLSKSRLEELIIKEMAQAHKYIRRQEESLTHTPNHLEYENTGHLLMAHAHLPLAFGQSKIVLEDFYTGGQREIKLKPGMNMAQNAEEYYRKARQAHKQHEMILSNIQNKRSRLLQLEKALSELALAQRPKDIESLSAVYGLQSMKEKAEVRLPYIEKVIEGFRVWIGKSAADNDLLTLKYAHKEDLWLHAKDVSGSHVLVKRIAGKPFPKSVVEQAAALAAYHSKRKTDTLAPVTVTERKYVRKSKGMPPGAVLVSREEVVLVKPKE